ncbi:MAG: HlyC/CorC family transporter [Ignavibacteriales bacterium]|nr:HlyC/CorC family transporter [Ignavibacteriales bacterium]
MIKLGLLKAKLSEDDLRQVLEASTLSGTLDKTEHELIKSIFEFTDTTVKEIMVPRPDIVALDLSMPRESLVRKVIEEGYSRLPVYKGTIDNIVGIVYSKDLLSLLEHRDLIVLQDIIRPVMFVPESKQVSQLLREFQQHKAHLAVVVDEFGGTEGIITMEDIVEEIVGEIHDEYDEVRKSAERSTDGSLVVDAHLSISDFNEQFSAQIPETADYETLAGFLQKHTGRLPDLNEEIKYDDLTFVIIGKTARRIRQVKVSKMPSTLSNNEKDA